MRENLSKFFDEKQGRILQFVLGGLMVLFIGILIGVYFISKNANPIFLDEKGNPINSESTHH
jgi:hypothetical protein